MCFLCRHTNIHVRMFVWTFNHMFWFCHLYLNPYESQVWTWYACFFWMLLWWWWKGEIWAWWNKKEMGNITSEILSFMTLWFKFTEKLLVPWILEVIFGLKVLDKLCGLFAFLCLHVIVSSIYLEKCLLRWILMHLFGLCNLAISMFVHMML